MDTADMTKTPEEGMEARSPNPPENSGARRVEQDYKSSADFALW